MAYATEEPADGSRSAFGKRMPRSDTSLWDEKVKYIIKGFLQDEAHRLTRHKLVMARISVASCSSQILDSRVLMLF